MKKMLKNIHRGKWSLVLIPVIMISLISLALFGYKKIFASMTYKLITDSNGIRWQYGFDPSNNKLEVSFFDSTNSITQITIPDKSYFINNDSSISTVSNYTFASYTSHGLGTPSTFSSTVTKIDLSAANEVTGVAPLLKTDTVTEVVFNTTASKIGKDAFRNAKLNAKNMNKITEIGHGAFYYVTFSTTTISMPNLTSLGNGSFEGSNITTVELNSPVIGMSAFKNCTSLTTATFKDNVNELSAGAFMGDTALSSVTFNKVKIIGSEAFKNCTSFNQDIKNTKIESIGAEAFAGTTGLTKSITIPDAVGIIPYKAFYGSNISGLDINNVYYIGIEAFENCHLSSLDFKNIERMDYKAFANNSLTEIDLPKTVVMLAVQVFYNNPIKDVTIRYDTLSTGINQYFFVSLNSSPSGSTAATVENITLVAPYTGSQRAQINSEHFSVNRTYNTFNISTPEANAEKNYVSSLKNVLQSAYLEYLPNVKTVVVGDGYQFIGDCALRVTQSEFNNRRWTSTSDTSFDRSAIKLESVSLPDTLKGVGGYSFYGNLQLDDLEFELPESLEFIGYMAFGFDYGLKQVIDLPNLKQIRDYAFFGSGIRGIEYHDTLEYLGFHVAYECFFLKSVIIDCDYYGLMESSFKLLNGSSASSQEIGNDLMNSFTMDRPYNGAMTTYGVDFDLFKMTDKVVTQPRYEGDYRSLFFYMKTKVLDIEDVKWTTMLGDDFFGINVETLKLPKKLNKINLAMFYGATIENELTLPDSITEIGNSGFMNLSANIKALPSNLKKIGDFAFYNFKYKDDLEVPSTVTKIGVFAFGSTTGVERNSVTFNCNLSATATSGMTIANLFVGTSINELILGENVTELPSPTLNGNSTGTNAYTSDFTNLNVQKVTFKGLRVLPDKAFVNNRIVKEVDFSEDPNFTKISAYAFADAANIEKVKLPTDAEITIGEYAFIKSGLKSIGDETSGLDVKNSNIILTDECTFQAMPRLESLNLTSGFNNGVIPNGTFTNEPELKKVELQNDITKIDSMAFHASNNIESFVMYGDTEIVEPNIQTRNNVSSISFSYTTSNMTASDFTITINDSVKGTTTITKSNFSSGNYTYSAGENASVTITGSDNISLYNTKGTIQLYDRSKMLTIPKQSNLYCYSTNELCQNYYDANKTYHDSENTNLYYLDEVIYMDSNGAPVELNEDNSELNTDGLVLYALRRDGVVLVSKEWKQKTGAEKYSAGNITIRDYNSNTDDPSLMIFNNNAAIESINTDANDNFENIEYVIGDVDPETEKVSVSFVYSNLVSDNDTDTTLRTQGNAADVTYSDGCGGEAFANVIFRDIAIGSETPSFGENPTREGYEFLWWDKEVSDTVTGDVIYRAVWNRIGDPVPEPPEPYNPWSNIVNPQTGILLIILLPIIILVVGSLNIYFKKKREA